MSFQHHEASETPKRKNGSCGNVLRAAPGKRHQPDRFNIAEFGRACDLFLLARVPGYRVMNIGKVDFGRGRARG